MWRVAASILETMHYIVCFTQIMKHDSRDFLRASHDPAFLRAIVSFLSYSLVNDYNIKAETKGRGFTCICGTDETRNGHLLPCLRIYSRERGI